MIKRRWYFLILLASLITAMIHGWGIENSLNVFVSWLAVGFWMCFTLGFLARVKYAREFRSPHNTSFFIVGSLFIGILYSLLGQFTELSGENLLGISVPYLSLWTVIFAVPYLMYGLFLLYSCFRRYDVVYIRQKSFNARKFGILSSFLTAIIGIYFALSFSGLMFWLLSIASVLLIIVFGIFSRRPAILDISTAVAAIRRQIPASRSSSTGETTVDTSPTPRRRSSTTTTTTTTTTTLRKKIKRKTKPKLSAKFEKLKPKAGILSLEDFKCIFCFNLPRPEDKGRGIVLCPNCRHPAHADEFKDWLKSSNLCSRCDATIPARFRRNPEIIPVKDYIKIIEEFKKTKRK